VLCSKTPNQIACTASPQPLHWFCAGQTADYGSFKLTKPTKAELKRANQFRAEVLELRQLPDHDWNDWELDWQESQIRRPPLYIYSEKEHAVLASMRRDATQFTGWDGYTASELIKSAHAYHLDYNERDQEFIERLHRRGATTLRLREMARLVRLCGIAGVPLATFDLQRDAA
jgi:pimeloyl-ACP methyl ester carboxylesterase